MTSKPAPPQVQTNPAQMAQQPFLTGGYQAAQNLYQNNPMSYYPGTTLAPYVAPNPLQAEGYQNVYNTGASIDEWLRPTTNAAYGSAVSGGMSGANSPANPYYTQYAQGTAGPQQQAQYLYDQALAGGQQYAGQVGGYAPTAAGYGATGVNQVAGQYAPQAAGYGTMGVNQVAGQYAPQAAGYGAMGINQVAGQYAPQAAGYGAMGAANSNLGLSQLGQSASGSYLNANPYFDQTVQSAIDPLARNYQTATAPTTDAMFSGGGRYGSGAMANAVSTNEQNLAKQIGDTSNQMYSANYNAERARQDAAASQYGQLYNAGLGLGIQGAQAAGNLANTAYGQGIQGVQAAGNLANTAYGQGIQGAQAAGNLANTAYGQGIQSATAAGNLANAAGNQYFQGLTGAGQQAENQATSQQWGATGLQNAYNSGNTAQMDALRMYPQLAQAQFIAPNAAVEAGKGLSAIDQQQWAYQQKAIEDEMARYYGVQNAPYQTLDQYMKTIGSPTGASGSTSQAMYQNPMANVLGTAAGVAGIAKTFAPMLGLSI